MEKRTASAAWVKGICELFNEVGLDVNALFSEAGLDITLLDSPHGRYPTEKIGLLWQLAANRSGNPMISIARPRRVKLENFNVIVFAMMSCQNLHASLECMLLYLRLVCEATTVLMREEPEGCSIELQYFCGGKIVPRQCFEYDMLTLLNFLQLLSGREFSPLWVEFTHATPPAPQFYHDAFTCPVRFNALANRLMFKHADLAVPLPTYNPTLAKFHGQFASQCLKSGEKKTGSLVRELIVQMLPSGEPRREDVASALCLGDRTLHRRLQEEGVSFQQILDDTRRELAQQYLEQCGHSVGEMAGMLGFADHGTFYRSCKRWFGESPKQYQTRFDSVMQRPGGRAELYRN